MSYEEQIGKELDEARIRVLELEERALHARVIDAAQALVDFSYTGLKVVNVNIDIAELVSFANVDPTVTVTPDTLAVDNFGDGLQMKYYVMFLCTNGDAWPTTKSENVFDTLAEAEEQVDRLQYAYEGRGSFYVLSSTTHPDDDEA